MKSSFENSFSYSLAALIIHTLAYLSWRFIYIIFFPKIKTKPQLYTSSDFLFFLNGQSLIIVYSLWLSEFGFHWVFPVHAVLVFLYTYVPLIPRSSRISGIFPSPWSEWPVFLIMFSTVSIPFLLGPGLAQIAVGFTVLHLTQYLFQQLKEKTPSQRMLKMMTTSRLEGATVSN